MNLLTNPQFYYQFILPNDNQADSSFFFNEDSSRENNYFINYDNYENFIFQQEKELNEIKGIKENNFFKTKIDEKLNDNLEIFECKNQEKYLNELENNNLMNMATKITSKTLGIKRERTKNNEGLKKKAGRKPKNEKEKGNHTKYSKDNVMRKIKSHLLEYIHENLNQSFKNKKYEFLKLDSNINKNLKKDYNIALMKKTLKELYENSSISSKYRKQKDVNSENNKKIIEEIYNEIDIEKKESDVINILNKTYLDLLKEFRSSNYQYFLEKIRKAERKKGEVKENIDSYIKIVTKLCNEYENWFEKKNGRKIKKKTINNY